MSRGAEQRSEITQQDIRRALHVLSHMGATTDRLEEAVVYNMARDLVAARIPEFPNATAPWYRPLMGRRLGKEQAAREEEEGRTLRSDTITSTTRTRWRIADVTEQYKESGVEDRVVKLPFDEPDTRSLQDHTFDRFLGIYGDGIVAETVISRNICTYINFQLVYSQVDRRPIIAASLWDESTDKKKLEKRQQWLLPGEIANGGLTSYIKIYRGKTEVPLRLMVALNDTNPPLEIAKLKSQQPS